MKKNKKIITTLSISLMSVLFVFAAIISATHSWFTLAASYTPTFKSTSEGAYFAYGDGTAESPYGINRPIHLYNLAWLQYLGYFETDNVEDSYALDNIYFELAADVDMAGWTLPPIGTKAKPFVGNFDGQGYKIKNLTVSNDLNDYNRIPFGITRSDFPSQINIVGLFGVVGKYESNAIATYNSQANQIVNTGITGLTVVSKSTTTLAGLAAGYVNGTISGVAVNSSYIDLRNSGGQAITGLTSNISDYSLIGHAADAKYLAQLQSSRTTHYTPTISNPFYSQGGNEWGASIDMESMYTTLRTKMLASNYYSGSYATFREDTRTKLNAGGYNPEEGYNEGTPTTTDYNITTNFGTSSKALYYYGNLDSGTNSENETVQTASYNFVSSYTKNNLSSDKYVGLGGKLSFIDYTYTNRKSTVTENNYTHYKFYDSTSSKYFTLQNNLFVGSDSSSASEWLFDSSSHLYTTSNGTISYVNVNGNNLVASSTASTTWTWDSANNALKASNKFLVYSSGSDSWSMSNSNTITDSFTALSNSNETYYLKFNGSTLSTTQNSSEATPIYFEDVDGTTYPYAISNGTKYYVSWVSGSGIIGTTSVQSYTYGKYNNTYRYRYNGNRYYYLTIGSSVNETTTSTNLSTPSVSNTKTIQINSSTTTKPLTTYEETIKNESVDANETYFPLTWDDDKVNPSEKNTGYVVSGTNYVDDSNPSIGDIRIASYYTTAMLDGSFISGSSYSNSNIFAYTFDSSGALAKIGDEINGKKTTSGYTSYETLGFKKYYYNMLGRASGSRVSLGTMLGTSGTNTAYGLHFMNADISMDNLITVPYAKINGKEKTQYDLPRDSIDFTLKDDGYINFFAATYYRNTKSTGGWNSSTITDFNNSNNSFFSLHIIDRNEDSNDCSIDRIKQIAKIYKNNSYTEGSDLPKYVYTYRNASDNEVTSSWDTGVRDSNGNIITGTKGDLVFDTYWLTDPEYSKFVVRALYYFEIPVNKGEFALGSTTGKTKTDRGWTASNTGDTSASVPFNKNGAYLLYLDIGASAKNVDGITVNDSSTTITKKYNYPIGIDFSTIDTTSTTAADYTTIIGGESAAIIIPSGNQQNINYTYTPKGEEKALLSVGPETGSATFTATYKTVGTEVKNKSGTSLGIVETSSSTDVMEREILYDLREMTGDAAVSVTPSITTVHTVDGVRGESIDSTGTAVTLSKAIVETMANFEPEEPVMLYVVDYSNTVTSNDSNKVTIDSSYSLLDKTYTISFLSAETGNTTEMMFVSLNLSQTYTENNASVTYTYTLIVQNVIDGTTSTQVGTITSSNINEDVIIICVVPASS